MPPAKTKTCSDCKKEFPKLFKTIVVEGEKKSFCANCAKKVKKKIDTLKVKERKEKAKVKRKEKRELITEKKLDAIFSKLVRTIYDPFCKSCGKSITFSTSHNAHLFSRVARCVRWDLRNCYNTCPNCNLFDQLHVVFLAKKQKEYYNIEIEDWINQIKQNDCKLNAIDRRLMFDIFEDAYNKALSLNEHTYKGKESFLLIQEVIEKTKKIM